MHRNLTHKKNYKITVRGFSIIELLVTLSIVVLATGLVMLKYASFNSSVLLNSQAYTVGFDIRKTQSLSVSVRGAGGDFREEYGMYFDMTTPNSYILFQDIGDRKPVLYDTDEEVGDALVIDPRFTITDICGTTASAPLVRHCYTEDGYPENISIAFARPDFEAEIYGQNMGILSLIEITIASNNDTSFNRTVEVTAAGQITIR